MSTAESEYRAIIIALQVGTLLHRILKFLSFMKDSLKTNALTDDMPSLDMLTALGGTQTSKFIDFRNHYIREKIKLHGITYVHKPAKLMKANIFTKPLTRHKFTTNIDVYFYAKMYRYR